MKLQVTDVLELQTANEKPSWKHRRQAALALAERGLPVLPLAPRSKTPAYDVVQHVRSTTETRAFYETPATTEEVTECFNRNPEINIAVFCGETAGFVALDVDEKSGGLETLRNLLDGELLDGALPPVPIHRSGSGWHILLPYPGHRCTFGPEYNNIQIRGDGQYIVWPPSLHPGGGLYTVLQSLEEFPLTPQEWFTRNLRPLSTAPVAESLDHTSGGTGDLSHLNDLPWDSIQMRLNRILDRRDTYPSGSEFDMAFLCSLVQLGLSDAEIGFVMSGLATGDWIHPGGHYESF